MDYYPPLADPVSNLEILSGTDCEARSPVPLYSFPISHFFLRETSPLSSNR